MSDSTSHLAPISGNRYHGPHRILCKHASACKEYALQRATAPLSAAQEQTYRQQLSQYVYKRTQQKVKLKPGTVVSELLRLHAAAKSASAESSAITYAAMIKSAREIQDGLDGSLQSIDAAAALEAAGQMRVRSGAQKPVRSSRITMQRRAQAQKGTRQGGSQKRIKGDAGRIGRRSRLEQATKSSEAKHKKQKTTSSTSAGAAAGTGSYTGKKGKGKQRQGGGRKRAAKDPMIGKQVSMPAAYWHIMDDDEGGFVGKILKAATWKCHGKKLEGYEIRFIDGIQLVPTADFLEHVI